MSDVAPPAVNTWDLPAIVADALEVLRLRDGDVDQPRVEACAATATELLDARLDRVETFDAGAVAHLHHAAVQVTVDLYPFQRPMSDLELDAVVAARPLYLPAKQRWGIA